VVFNAFLAWFMASLDKDFGCGSFSSHLISKNILGIQER
jgi:hypothetical protein